MSRRKSRTHRVVKKCSNVTLVRIGDDLVKIWSDGRGDRDRHVTIYVYSDNPAEFATQPLAAKPAEDEV